MTLKIKYRDFTDDFVLNIAMPGAYQVTKVINACISVLEIQTSKNLVLEISCDPRMLGAATSGSRLNKNLIPIKIGFKTWMEPEKGLEALCHECVHVSQIVSERLIEEKHRFLWEGTPFSKESIEQLSRKLEMAMHGKAKLAFHNKEELNTVYNLYRAFPWEKEAFEKTPALMEQVKKILNKGD